MLHFKLQAISMYHMQGVHGLTGSRACLMSMHMPQWGSQKFGCQSRKKAGCEQREQILMAGKRTPEILQVLLQSLTPGLPLVKIGTAMDISSVADLCERLLVY